MDINTLAAWGEFLGGIAVVVSLVYLAGQIRQNSRLLAASTSTTTDNYNNSMNTLIIQDPVMARIFWDGLADRETLSEPDRRRFDPMMSMTVNSFQQHFRLARDGVLGSEAWTDIEKGQSYLAHQPGFRDFWTQWREAAYSGRFRDYMDGLIRESEAAG